MRDDLRDDYLLISIDPPLIGQNFGLGERDISRLILSSRRRGQTLFPILEWPAFVYVTRILDEDVSRTLEFTSGQVELIAWGALLPTLDDAVAFAGGKGE